MLNQLESPRVRRYVLSIFYPIDAALSLLAVARAKALTRYENSGRFRFRVGPIKHIQVHVPNDPRLTCIWFRHTVN